MSSGSENRQRQVSVRIRFSESERATLIASAEHAGLSVAGYARAVLLSAPPVRQARRPPVERAELAKLLAQIGKTGSNINQIARAANGGDPVSSSDLRQAIQDIALMRDALMKALGRVP